QHIVAHAVSQAFYPNQLSDIYGFPKDLTGKNQCIAIIELGGGYRTEDIATYFKQLGLPTPDVIAVSVDGSINDPTTPDGADAEVVLDIEVAAAIAPDAKIVVYFTPNTDKGFFDAIHTAVYDKQNRPSILSISWGSPEDNWTDQSRKTYNDAFQTAAMLGITICVAAGDNGSSDGMDDGKVHVDFPASSPFVLGCGGTTLAVKNQEVVSETVWHNTGGGVSDYFDKPDYQQQINVPTSPNSGFAGRGVPDIAADANPNTGYQVLVDGQNLVIGGTSAVAPLMAGLIARINQQQGKPVGFIHHDLYNGKYKCRDITEGDNKTVRGNKGYAAAKGWDACTGWGVLYCKA
ncbi:MAG: S53 family peptidase, partial [Candidatus Saccharimonadales bacterium]